MATPAASHVAHFLSRVAQGVASPKEINQKACQAVNTVVSYAQKTLRNHKIVRTVVAGSYGKSTHVYPDFDIDIVLIIQPPEGFPHSEEFDLSQILQDLDACFAMADFVDDTSTKRRAVSFRVGGFEIDLLVAPDLVGSPRPGPGQVQAQELRRLFAKSDPGRLVGDFSCAFAEETVSFFKACDSFVHEVIRLTRLWGRTLFFEPPWGFKYFLELVAAYCAIEDKRFFNDNGDLERVIESILRQFADCKNICVVWPRQPPPKERPVVMDVANEFNNVANTFDEEAVQSISEFAKKSLELWERRQAIGVHHIFRPKFSSKVAIKLRQEAKVANLRSFGEHRWLVGIYDNPEIQVPQLLQVQKRVSGNFDIDLPLKVVCDVLVVTRGTCLLDRNTAKEWIQTAIDDIRKPVFRKEVLSPWINGLRNHEEYSVTITVPFSREWCAKVSFDIEGP
eukprot:2934257-Rhodomonas_salina.3